MAAERRARSTLYCGPLTECSRAELPGVELRGGYVAEQKYDGAWCALHVDHAGPRQHRFESRVGLEFDGSSIDGIGDVDLGTLGKGTVLIGELEVASEVATKAYKEHGYRRFFCFDVAFLRGTDLRSVFYGERIRAIEQVVKYRIPRKTMDSGRVHLVDRTHMGFQHFYDQVVKKGGEGIVLKPLTSASRPTRADGKTPEWVRCKPWATVDYVVCGHAFTEKGELTAKLGLSRDGKVRAVMQCGVPGLKLESPNGPLVQNGEVVELYGRELMASGALRHATFLRFRSDKLPEDCTGERMLWTEKPETK